MIQLQGTSIEHRIPRSSCLLETQGQNLNLRQLKQKKRRRESTATTKSSTRTLKSYGASSCRTPRMLVYVPRQHTTLVTYKHRANCQTTTSSQTVTDFSILMYVSHYVIPQWSQIGALPASLKDHEKGMPVPTIRETLEEYTSSKNTFKEFWMKKLALWDFERVTQLITDLVRSTGCPNTIKVHFPMEAYKMVARTLASDCSLRAAHSMVIRLLCVLSCLHLVFWPASRAIARKRIKNRLVCEYPMAVDVNEFFSRNSAKIQSIVINSHRGEKLVAL